MGTLFALGHSDGPDAGIEAIDRWLSWAARCCLHTFNDLGHKIRRLTRVAFGLHSVEALIALAMLSLVGYPPELPGRT
ncbi:MAG: hypothetical protein ACKOW5_10860 [Actinomycetales bacterium]